MYDTTKFTDFKSFVTWVVVDFANPLIKILFALSVVLFLWGVLGYVRAVDNVEKRSEGKEFMFWGVVALAVIGALWALVGIVVYTITGPSSAPPTTPLPAPAPLVIPA
ncbi:MAG: hypothetical protein ACYC8S_00180 [Minisyncoccota bacterium]